MDFYAFVHWVFFWRELLKTFGVFCWMNFVQWLDDRIIMMMYVGFKEDANTEPDNY